MTRKEVGRALDLTDRLADEYSPQTLLAELCCMQAEFIKAVMAGDALDDEPQLGANGDHLVTLWPEKTINAE